MIIKADKEGILFIKDLCDLALKVGGINNLNAATKLISSIEEIKTKPNENKESKKVVIKKVVSKKDKRRKTSRRRK